MEDPILITHNLYLHKFSLYSNAPVYTHPIHQTYHIFVRQEDSVEGEDSTKEWKTRSWLSCHCHFPKYRVLISLVFIYYFSYLFRCRVRDELWRLKQFIYLFPYQFIINISFLLREMDLLIAALNFVVPPVSLVMLALAYQPWL